MIGLPGDRSRRAAVVILNGRPVQRRRIADFALPISPNSPCRGRRHPPAHRPRRPWSAAYPPYRDPAGRPQLRGARPGQGRRATLRADRGARRPAVRDGRQSRRQPRQPLPRQAGGVGLLPIENLLGRATIAFWSTDGSAGWLKPWTWFGAARWDRIGKTAGERRPRRLARREARPSARQLTLFELALTHASPSEENYERLEFLGDRVLGLATAAWLYELFPEPTEGKLSRPPQRARRARDLRRGRARDRHPRADAARQAGARGRRLQDSDNVLGDIVEALIGAVFIDAGFEAAEAVVQRAVGVAGRRARAGAQASQVGAAGMGRRQRPPARRPTRWSAAPGPHHAQGFIVEVSIKDIGEASAEGATKQEAETAAAEAPAGAGQ